jgi:putative nucleotidyltransferase with HDIG domain
MGSFGDSLGRAFDKVVGAFADRVADALTARAKPGEAAPVPAAAAPPASTADSLVEKVRELEREKQRVEKALATAMDPMVARLMLEGKLSNEKRAATVMFADLVSFTTAAEVRPPESMIEDVDMLFSSMEPVLKRFRGHLDKYMGDALMAEFGAPYKARNHALMAALAAVRMQDRMTEWQFPWKLRIGIASGPLVVGLIGSGSRKNYTAIGDNVNLASRLQQLSPPGGILVDEEVYKAVSRWFKTRRVRVGMTPEEERNLEARLALLEEAMVQSPSAKMLAEAADVCSELGDLQQALAYHRRALELDPASMPATNALAAALLTGEDRAFIQIKGKRQRVAAYEILGLKPAVEPGPRIPHAVVEVHRRLVQQVALPEDWMLGVEAVEGALGHAEATAALCGSLAEFIGLGEADVRKAFLGGYLHDIGKKAVPEHLLTYEGPLSDLPESDLMSVRAHATLAAAVLKELKVPAPADVLTAIAQHHENFDGSGYPQGLKGKEISVFARLIRVCEAYDALSSWRPYREAWTPDAALAEVSRDINRRRVDPELGEAFLRMMGVNRSGVGVPK